MNRCKLIFIKRLASDALGDDEFGVVKKENIESIEPKAYTIHIQYNRIGTETYTKVRDQYLFVNILYSSAIAIGIQITATLGVVIKATESDNDMRNALYI